VLDKGARVSIGAGYVGGPCFAGASRRWAHSVLRGAAVASGLAIVFGSEFAFTLLGIDDPACCLVALVSMIAGWSALASAVLLVGRWRARAARRAVRA